MKPIVSVQELAWTIGVPVSRLRTISRNINDYYHVWSEIDEAKKESRCFRVPNSELKKIQRRIANRILKRYDLPPQVHGGVDGSSPETNARQHLAQPCVVKADVRKFYPSVSHRRVHYMFRREFGFGGDVSYLLTRLTTFDGQLPQGAPTSTCISNHLLSLAVDRPLQNLCQEHQGQYTRFVDDLTFSGSNPRFLINSAGQLLSRLGLRIWRGNALTSLGRRKLQVCGATRPQEVTGLNVNSRAGPSVPRAYRDRVRASINRLQFLPSTEKMVLERSIKGKISYIRRFNSGAAKRLQRTLDRQNVKWE